MTRALSKGMTPSVLDRLIDPESGGTAARPGYSLEQIVHAVQRDLEELLNARLSRIDIAGEFRELRTSPLNFGLPDFGSIATATQHDHDRISQRIELAIERFEPRLRDVHVRLVEGLNETGALTLQFQIEAQLKISPYPDVSFETILELTTGVTKVKAVRV